MSERKSIERRCLPAGCLRSLALLATLHMLPITVANADEASSPTQEVPRLPLVKSLGSIYYPDKAKLRDVEGSVLAEFSINAKGKVTDLKLVRVDNPLFADVALKSLSAGKYAVPGNWSAANATVRYRVVMVFCLPPSDQTTTFTESPYDPIIVAGSRIGHPPVQTVPGTCKARQ